MLSREAFVHYKINNDEIDKGHWSLIEKLNVLLKAAKEKDFPVIESGISSLDSELNIHLEAEEKLMLETSFPYFNSHKSEHTNLLAMMSSLKGAQLITDSSFSKLEKVFVEHMDNTDSQFGLYLAKQSSE